MNDCKEVLEVVIENGRVSGNEDGEFAVGELVVQVEFEANERGLDPEECVEYALDHTRHT